MEETTCAAVSRILSSDPKTLWKTDQWRMLEINKYLDVNKFTSDLDLVQNMNEYFEKVRQEEFQKVKKNKKEFEEIDQPGVFVPLFKLLNLQLLLGRLV